MIKILNKKTEKELNIDTTKINFEYNYNEYSYVGIKQSSIFDNFIYNDKNNLILKKQVLLENHISLSSIKKF